MSKTTTRRSLLGGTAAAILAGLAGCGGDDGGDGDNGDGGGPTVVEMTDELVFDPDSITISVGDTVEWENVGSIDHSVTAYEDDIPDGAEYFASGGFDSEQDARDGYFNGNGHVAGDETYSHTFETAGEYEYFCVPHESTMTGTITVEET